jgi:transcriptional regulator with XRE-family HTH domain
MVKNSSSSVESGVTGPAPWLPIGQRLRNRRVQLGFRKGAVAAHLGVSMASFEEIEAGQVEISPVLLGRLSELLKVPVLYFFEDMFPSGDAAEPCQTERGAVSDEERLERLVAAFRKLDRDKQQYLLVLAGALEQDTGSVRVIAK